MLVSRWPNGLRRYAAKVLSVDAQNGHATAQVTASGQTFAFRPNDPIQIKLVRAGQPIYANFRTNQVSLDGRTIFGTIIPLPASIPTLAPNITAGSSGGGHSTDEISASGEPLSGDQRKQH